MSTVKNKEDYIIDFVRAFKAVEDEMEPYKEHRRDLKKNYVENAWLSKDELRFVVKAYRMMKQGDDFDQFKDIFDKISKKISI